VCMYSKGECIHMCLGVCSCEFIGWVLCCNVSELFGEIGALTGDLNWRSL